MSIKNLKNYEINAIVKDLDSLLRKIDYNILWADYIPAQMLGVQKDLVAISYKNNTVKYVDITNESSFEVARSVCNAIDDYCFEKMFMTNNQLQDLKNHIEILSRKRTEMISQAVRLLSRTQILNDADCLEIYDMAQLKGTIPEAFPFNIVQEKDARNVLIDFLNTGSSTYIDIQILLEDISNIYNQNLSKYAEIEDVEMAL